MYMKTIKLAAVAAVLVGTAAAEDLDTLVAVTTNGVVLTTSGYSIDIDYADDGTYSGSVMGSAFTGKWNIDGDQLCTSSSLAPTETCTTYPAGKGPGDSFEVENPTLGTVTVKINE